MFLWIFFLIFSFSGNAQNRAHTLQNRANLLREQFREVNNDTTKLNILISLSDLYYEESSFKAALFYNNYVRLFSAKLIQSKDVVISHAGKTGEAYYFHNLGNIMQRRSDYRQALQNYFKALDLFKVLDNREARAILFSDIATTYSSMGNFNESLNSSFKALKLEEILGDEKRVAIELNNIGAIYDDLHNYSKALEYCVKARDLSLKHNDKKYTALYTGTVGHCYQQLCDSADIKGNTKLSLELQNKALEYYSIALNMSREVGDLDNMAVCIENTGLIYLNVYDYKNALPYLLKALGIYKKLGQQSEESFCLHVLGETYQGLGYTNKAEVCYKEALEMAKQINSNYYLMKAYEGNSEFYEKINRPGKALEYYKKYIIYKDSIFNQETTRDITRTQLNYDFEKKEAATKFENDKVVYRLEADSKLFKQWRLFFIVVIALVLIAMYFVKRAYDNKKKLATLLVAEDQRKEVLLQEVHHRINNNLQIISSLLTLQANNADNEQLTEYLMQSQNRIQSLSAMHELLYDTNSPLDINMKDYISKVLDFHRDVAGSMSAKITIEEHIEPVKFLTKQAVPVALIINELVTNSLKYAFTGKAEGKVNVTLKKNPDEEGWIVTVRDNGKGMPQDTGKRQGSLGLKLVNIMTKQIGGIFQSENENGACFRLIFGTLKKK